MKLNSLKKSMLVLMLLSVFILVGCNEDSSDSTDADVEVVSIIDDGATLVYLDIADIHGAQLNDYGVNHGVVVTVGLDPDSEMHSDQVYVGLVPVHDADADKTEQHTCLLGVIDATFTEDILNEDGYAVFSQEFIVPEGCLEDGETKKDFNFWVSVNPAIETGDDADVHEDDFNAQFFNDDQVDLDGADRNELCLDRDGEKGCPYVITVHESPGLDILLKSVEPASSVMVLNDTCEIDHGSADVEALVDIAIYGAPSDDGETEDPDHANILPSDVEISYSICPRDEDSGACIDGEDYEAVGISGHSANDDDVLDADTSDTSVQDTVLIEELSNGNAQQLAHDLHVEHTDGLCEGMLGLDGGSVDWDEYSLYNVRVCAAPVDTLDEAGHCDNSDDCEDVVHDDNNCIVTAVRMVREHIEPEAAVSKTLNKGWSKHLGNKIVNSTFGFSTNNTVDLSGARTANYAGAKVGGWVSFDIFKVWMDAAANVAIVGSYYDMGVELIEIVLWSKSHTIHEVDLSEEKMYSKSLCYQYGYTVAGLGLKASICAVGKAGVEIEAGILAVRGSGKAPFADSTKIGEIDVTVTPLTELGLSAAAVANLAVLKGGIKGYLTLARAELPITATLNWGLVDTGDSSIALVVTSEAAIRLVLTFLEGKIKVWVEAYKPKWCKKWWGGYPCGGWKTIYSKTLLTLNGYKYKKNLWSYTPPQLTLQ